MPLLMTDFLAPAVLHAVSDEDESLNRLPGQVAFDMDTPQEVRHSSGDTFATLMKHPDDELFHCMVSYRVKTDAERARAIHDGLHFKALNAKKKLDLFVMAQYPAGFNRPQNAKQSWLNVFLDKSCLQDCKNWADDGFLSAILKSLTFIPILSWETAANGQEHKGSVGGLATLSKDSPIDNVLLELVLAKELHSVLKEFAKKSNQKNALYPCMHIFPILVQDLVMTKISTLSDDAPLKTLAKAAAVLGMNGIQTDDAFMKQSVKSIMQYFLNIQGVQYYNFGSTDASNEQTVSRIWDHLKKQSIEFDIDRFQLDSYSENIDHIQLNSFSADNPHGSELLQFLLAEDAGYLSRFLMKRAISSVAMLADFRLCDDEVRKLALEVSTVCKRPLSSETVKIVRILNAAAQSQLALPLRQRLDDFVDTDASILTAIYR
jgi:hypothetical protein